jgi:hypothetical protein
MRNVPDLNNQYDVESLADLKAEPWMLELLKLNPDYTFWGPHEDYMWKEGDGWDSRILNDSWHDFGFSVLDDLNECANFYFEVVRDSAPCEYCEQTGYNPETKQIADDFFSNAETGHRWRDQITQDEVDTLVEQGRLRKYDSEQHVWVQVPRTAAEVNAANHGGGGLGELYHDAINRSILVETRAKRLGVWGYCEHCHGEGEVYTEEQAHVNLVLWILHPRKGCSRGVEVKNIHQEDLPAVFAWLKTAAERNAQRFNKVTSLP